MSSETHYHGVFTEDTSEIDLSEAQMALMKERLERVLLDQTWDALTGDITLPKSEYRVIE